MILNRFCDIGQGGHGGLFSVSPPSAQRWWNGTKFMQVMEQPHGAISPQRRAFFVPVLRGLSTLGAVIGLGVFWVAELKRDPRAPFKTVAETFYRGYSWDKVLVTKKKAIGKGHNLPFPTAFLVKLGADD
jgi:hypothetical protein